MSRISETFRSLKNKNEKAFIPFITAGDPDLETTERLIPELEKAGADIIELGVPFSDPIADGPVIQRSSERALRKNYTLFDIFSMVRHVRQSTCVPMVLFSYFNPLLQIGVSRLAADAKRVGIDGILVTDLTPEEAEPFRTEIRREGIDTIFLVAPTSSPPRVRLICEASSGFVYLVSRTGVTGTRDALADGIVPMIGELRRCTALPVAVGFGISNPEQVRQICQHADAAVVGSAIVAKIEEWGNDKDLVTKVGEFARWLKAG